MRGWTQTTVWSLFVMLNIKGRVRPRQSAPGVTSQHCGEQMGRTDKRMYDVTEMKWSARLISHLLSLSICECHTRWMSCDSVGCRWTVLATAPLRWLPQPYCIRPRCAGFLQMNCVHTAGACWTYSRGILKVLIFRASCWKLWFEGPFRNAHSSAFLSVSAQHALPGIHYLPNSLGSRPSGTRRWKPTQTLNMFSHFGRAGRLWFISFLFSHCDALCMFRNRAFLFFVYIQCCSLVTLCPSTRVT